MTALAPTIQAFFTQRLVQERNASPHTIAAYRDTIKLLLRFAAARTGRQPSTLDVSDLDADTIAAFLDHLQTERNNSARTRNARLAAVHSLYRYAALRHPEPDSTAKEGVGLSIVLAEADPVGLFLATSVSEPVLHGGVLFSVFAYLIYLQPAMAAVALMLFVPQCCFVPLVQKAINRRTASRIRVMRNLSADLVGGTAQGVLEREEGGYKQRVRQIYSLDMQVFRRKYAVNFLINLLYHLGTVGILAVGGWFVMQGRTEVGTVVAFISGLTKVNDPWNDLVTFFRDMTNARVKYQLIAKVLDDGDPGELAEPA